MKKLIEVALPLPEINDASVSDKRPECRPHPKGIHQWWARLPLPAARAVLFTSVIDDPSSNPTKFPTEELQNAERERLFGIVRELMQKKLHEKPEVYEKAHAEMLLHTGGTLPPVLDPFAGGGSSPLEAARLGFEAHATDLNPVAVLLNKCNLEIVPRWLDCPPVNPESKLTEKQGDATGLAEDVRYYGEKIREAGFRKTFTSLREKRNPDFPLTVYYAFKQADEESGSVEEGDDDAETSGGVDVTTGWALDWFKQHGLEEGDFGDAETLSRAKKTAWRPKPSRTTVSFWCGPN